MLPRHTCEGRRRVALWAAIKLGTKCWTYRVDAKSGICPWVPSELQQPYFAKSPRSTFSTSAFCFSSAVQIPRYASRLSSRFTFRPFNVPMYFSTSSTHANPSSSAQSTSPHWPCLRHASAPPCHTASKRRPISPAPDAGVVEADAEHRHEEFEASLVAQSDHFLLEFQRPVVFAPPRVRRGSDRVKRGFEILPAIRDFPGKSRATGVVAPGQLSRPQGEGTAS